MATLFAPRRPDTAPSGLAGAATNTRAARAAPAAPSRLSSPAFARGREAASLLLFVSAVFLSLAMASFEGNPADLAVEGPNWVGPVGASCARFLLGAIGITAWTVPVELLMLAWPLLKNQASIATLTRIAGDFLVVLIVAALTQVALPGSTINGAMPAGGAVGELFGELMRSLFSTIGSFLIGLTAIGLILIGRASFSFIAWAQRATQGTELAASKAAHGAKAVAQAWASAAELRRQREQQAMQRGPVIHEDPPGEAILEVLAPDPESSPPAPPVLHIDNALRAASPAPSPAPAPRPRPRKRPAPEEPTPPSPEAHAVSPTPPTPTNPAPPEPPPEAHPEPALDSPRGRKRSQRPAPPEPPPPAPIRIHGVHVDPQEPPAPPAPAPVVVEVQKLPVEKFRVEKISARELEPQEPRGQPDPREQPEVRPREARAEQAERQRAPAAARAPQEEPEKPPTFEPFEEPEEPAAQEEPEPSPEPVPARRRSPRAAPRVAPEPSPEPPPSEPAPEPSPGPLAPLKALLSPEHPPTEPSPAPRPVLTPASEDQALAAKAREQGPRIFEKVEDPRPAPRPAAPMRKPMPENFQLPGPDLLDPPLGAVHREDPEVLLARAKELERVLHNYGVKGTVVDIHTGPTVSTFELIPAEGTKVRQVAGLDDDLALGLSCKVRIVAPIPGKNRIGFELPNRERIPVNLRELVEDRKFQELNAPLPVVMGRDIVGAPFYADLSSMPHVIVAGATGAGKSVGLNVMLVSLLMRRNPEQLRMLMVDPKVVELAPFDRIPHLLLPVVTDMKQAANALKWAVDEMERRYQLFANAGTKNIATYNAWVERAHRGEVKGYTQPRASHAVTEDGSLLEVGPEREAPPLPEKIPYIVIVVDEFADLIMQQGKDVEAAIARLAQKARAAGMHVILATQRPSTDVITGTIKSNFPSRVAFRVVQWQDSKTILDEKGAEQLLGKGDMLVKLNGATDTRRVQGPFVFEEEVQRVCDFLRAQGEPVYDESISRNRDEEDGRPEEEVETDPKYDEAVRVVAETRKCSTSWLQRKLGLGYNRAAKIVEVLEKQGIVGPANGSKEREVLIGPV
jgi:S-DNA-T family DNA segregation ATPase FtsK/SpoIIIE